MHNDQNKFSFGVLDVVVVVVAILIPNICYWSWCIYFNISNRCRSTHRRKLMKIKLENASEISYKLFGDLFLGEKYYNIVYAPQNKCHREGHVYNFGVVFFSLFQTVVARTR